MAGMKIEAIQTAIREAGFDGWLFYDHHHRDPIAGPSWAWTKRRTSRGAGTTLCLSRESRASWCTASSRPDWTRCPERKRCIQAGRSSPAALEAMLAGARTLAMQYSPNNAIMYVSLVDAGTVEFLAGWASRSSARPIWSANLRQF